MMRRKSDARGHFEREKQFPPEGSFGFSFVPCGLYFSFYFPLFSPSNTRLGCRSAIGLSPQIVAFGGSEWLHLISSGRIFGPQWLSHSR